MFNLKKLSVLIGMSLLVGCGGGGSSGSNNPDPVQTHTLTVDVHAKSDDVVGGTPTIELNSNSTKSTDSQNLVVCIDVNANDSCDQNEPSQAVNQNTGKATLSWTEDDFAHDKNYQVIVTDKQDFLLINSMYFEKGASVAYPSININSLSTLQSQFGSASALKEFLSVPESTDLSSSVLNSTEAKILNDMAFELGIGIKSKKFSTIKSHFENAYTKIQKGLEDGLESSNINAGIITAIRDGDENALGWISTEVSDTNHAPKSKFVFASTQKEVSFDNLSSDSDNDQLTYEWNFGDGSSSTEKSPKHTYENYGTYNVSLRVSDGKLSDVTSTNVVLSCVEGVDCPVAETNHAPSISFTVTPKSNSRTVTIKNNTTDADGDDLTYTWNFGDGTESNEKSTSFEHTYAKDGKYIVVLTANDGKKNGESTKSSNEFSVSVTEEQPECVTKQQCNKSVSSCVQYCQVEETLDCTL